MAATTNKYLINDIIILTINYTAYYYNNTTTNIQHVESNKLKSKNLKTRYVVL